METLHIDCLAIGYPHHLVAEGLTASLSAGTFACLIGENGVGKSTLLRTLACFREKQGGVVQVCGKEIEEYGKGGLARLVSVVLTSRPDVHNLSAREVVALGRTPYTNFWGTLRQADRDIVDRAITTVDIKRLADKQIDCLSDGELQKVMIARALAQQTSIILLDEPTAFLDYPSKVSTMTLLRRLAHEEGKTILLSTHDLQLAFRFADDLWFLSSEGRLYTGAPQEMEKNEAVKEFEASPQPSPKGKEPLPNPPR